jgi:hypothetical protein
MAVDAVTCAGCGETLDEVPSLAFERREPCPTCGSRARTYQASVTATLKVRASVSWEHVRVTVRRHWGWFAVAMALGVAGAASGYLLAGTLAGVAVAITVAVLGTIVRGKATTREKVVTRSGPGRTNEP